MLSFWPATSPTRLRLTSSQFAIGLALFCFFPNMATAQNGSFLEGLFRTIAEKQLQKAQSESRARANPDPVTLPNQPSDEKGARGGFPGGPLGPALSPTRGPSLNPATGPRTSTRDSDSKNPRSPGGHSDHNHIHDHAHSIAEFRSEVERFDRSLKELFVEVQSQIARNRDREVVNELRLLLPEIYRLQAEVRVIASRSRKARSVDELVDAYRIVDQQYHDLSFRLRSLPTRDEGLQARVASCDKYCRVLSQACSIAPQFDRHALHDQIVIAATYIQVLMDDLSTARMSIERSRELTHQARLLRHAMLEKADIVETVAYDDVVADFTSFVARWQQYAETVAAVRDPVLDRRLVRVRECGDQIYAILWMPPIERPAGVFVGDRNGRYDTGEPVIGDPRNRYLEQWISDAAALEVAAEYLQADLRRLIRYLQPASYARTVSEGSDRVYQTARTLHSELETGQPLTRLQRTTGELVTVWKSFSDELNQLDRHGLSGRRAEGILRQQEHMLPIIASLSASLLPLNER